MKENMQSKQKEIAEENPYHIYYDNYMETTSSETECTGLIPSGDKDREEWERYKDLFSFGGYE